MNFNNQTCCSMFANINLYFYCTRFENAPMSKKHMQYYYYYYLASGKSSNKNDRFSIRQSVSSGTKIGPRTGSEFLVMGSANGSCGIGMSENPHCPDFLAQPWIRSEMMDPVATHHCNVNSNVDRGSYLIKRQKNVEGSQMTSDVWLNLVS